MNSYFDKKLIEHLGILPQLFSTNNAEQFIIYANRNDFRQNIFSYIAEEAYWCIVNGKYAIDWIMKRCVETTYKESGIRYDPNDWSIEHNNHRYILDLLLSVITVSVKTVDIVVGLPKVEWR